MKPKPNRKKILKLQAENQLFFFVLLANFQDKIVSNFFTFFIYLFIFFFAGKVFQKLLYVNDSLSNGQQKNEK